MAQSSQSSFTQHQAQAVPLAAVISTAELARRPFRPPDFEAENLALVALAKEMVGSPRDILQRLVEKALHLCRAGSCGISIIEEDGGPGIFRWHALVGALAEHRWETTPRNFSPCGTVVDTNAIQLMSQVHRHFTYFAEVNPLILEALLVPFAVGGRTVGTIWVVMHDEDRCFDAEDARLLANLGQFAAAAYQVKSSLEQINEADRRKDEFLATLAHELRNPLAALQSAAHFLKERSHGTADHELQMMSEVNQRQLTAMTRMIDDLMDVSRITRNKITLHCERVDLAQIVGDAIQMNRALICAAGHELSVELPERPFWIRGDATRLVQIVANLLHNAVKFTPSAGRISIKAYREDAGTVIRVRDEGIGIAQHMLSKIFEPFAQVDGAGERAHSGLGIGLSMVKRLTELHGGTVQAQSRGNGCGSEFTVRLPRASDDDSAATVRTAQPSAPEVAVTQKLRIMVVDDNHDSADSIGLLLRLAGHDVRVCYDGASALDQVTDFSPDAILQDIAMPGMGGLEIARRLRAMAATRNTTLIALSGYGQAQDLQRSRDAGFAHHLVKPVDFEVLQRLLGSLCAGRVQ
jgi:signal transduction histidine kinase/ActR/RegA family two-component response regulator